jgi:hypothetical protein
VTFDTPAGVHHLHDDVSLDFQLNRLAGLGGGQLEEIRNASSRITDLDDWKREFLSLAELALSEERTQHAAAYLRAAEFNMAPTDPDKAIAYERQAKLFRDLHRADFETGRLRTEDVPYDGGHLPAWSLSVPDGQESMGTIVVHGGFDSYGEELYPLARAISGAGYDTVLFEGPGQGSVMRRQGIHFTTEWEKPVGAVLDHFGLGDVTLVGLSLGGYLAPRAAAFEPRIRKLGEAEVELPRPADGGDRPETGDCAAEVLRLAKGVRKSPSRAGETVEGAREGECSTQEARGRRLAVFGFARSPSLLSGSPILTLITIWTRLLKWADGCALS